MLKNWVSKALHLNKCTCLIMAKINQNLENFCTGDTIELSEAKNIKLLHDPEILQRKVNILHHPEFIKQRSQMWFDMHKKASIRGSTIYHAIGLENLKSQKEYFDEFILKKAPKTECNMV